VARESFGGVGGGGKPYPGVKSFFSSCCCARELTEEDHWLALLYLRGGCVDCHFLFLGDESSPGR
jgi:hypothetical protein